MKKLALISSHCDTEEKKQILESNISLLKKLGIDTFVISTIKIDVDADFLFFTKENPILTWPERGIVWYKDFYINDRILSVSSTIDDYGWASLYQIKKVMEFASTYDYDVFYFLIYDLNFDEKIISDINNNLINLIYPRKDFGTEKIYPSSLHFAIFDKRKLKLFSDLIDKNSYIKLGTEFAEDFVHKCCIAMGMNHSEYPVTDLIQVNNFGSVLNYSFSENYKFFHNNDENNFRILFYDIISPISVNINDLSYDIFQNMYLIETEIKVNEITRLSVVCDNQESNYIDSTYRKTRNHINFKS